MRISDWSSDVCSSDLSRTSSYAEPSPRWRWPATPERLKVLGRPVQHGGGGLLHALTEHRNDRQYPRCVEIRRHTLASKKNHSAYTVLNDPHPARYTH